MASNSGQGNNIAPVVLTNDGTPLILLGVFSIPTNLRSYSATVLTGPAIFNNVSVEAGVTVAAEARPGETLPGWDIDATNARVLFFSIRELP